MGEQFGLFNSVKEETAFKLLFKDKKRILETAEELSKRNMPMSVKQLENFKKNAFEIMKDHEKTEALADYFLESYERVKLEFDWMVDKVKDLIDKAAEEGKDFKQLAMLKEFHSQIRTTMSKMGKLQGEALSAKTDASTTINANNVLVLMKGMQENWFREMDAKMVNGKLIFNDPKPEILDSYNSWVKKEEALLMKPGVHVVNGGYDHESK